jgi:4a-hydroxytetrahydrobiopterin dehydratase
MARLLTQSEIQEKLKTLKDWTLVNQQIQKKYSFKDFTGAMAFVTRVALLAEPMDHHPDIDIRYNKVFLTLSTHSAGGLTELDFTLASHIDS